MVAGSATSGTDSKRMQVHALLWGTLARSAYVLWWHPQGNADSQPGKQASNPSALFFLFTYLLTYLHTYILHTYRRPRHRCSFQLARQPGRTVVFDYHYALIYLLAGRLPSSRETESSRPMRLEPSPWQSSNICGLRLPPWSSCT